MCKLLEKEMRFIFDEAYLRAFECLKEKPISSPVIIGPDWAEPFEVMYGASSTALGVVLGQKRNKMFNPIYYAIKDMRGCENKVADHLSRLEAEKKEECEQEINDAFPDEQVLVAILIPWLADFANVLVSDLMPGGLTFQQRKRFPHNVGKYFWDEPYLYRVCADNIIRRCVLEPEMLHILEACHSSPRQKSISRCNELPMTPILEVELFNVWGVNFMGLFVSSYGQKYILVVVDYVSKWVETVALPENDSKSVAGFLKKNIFSRFGTPRDIISDGGSHFCNKVFSELLAKYGVKQHKVATPYHPHTNGQVEVSNREIKVILAKTVNTNMRDWA
ncbi:uncharacterized protein [Solanum tuberosum]|uniref:uncharacterized protein n=1 Tax=Solanum tuberosum TaxID=4113 RepID=UPI00073A1CC4|nr:PREDICTED: uncharacterized protein LOC107062428 [Solanum tuberosum]